jgi:hypothetical protein
MRAPMWTAMPPTLSPMNSISPVHTPARTSIPRARTADTIAWGAAHRPRWAIECGEEAVPSGADLHSAIAAEHRPHSLVVALPECLPRAVAHQAGTLGGSNDVGEEDAGKHAVELGLFGLLSTKEPLDLHDDAVRVAQPGHVVSTWHANRAPGMRSAMLIDPAVPHRPRLVQHRAWRSSTSALGLHQALLAHPWSTTRRRNPAPHWEPRHAASPSLPDG